MLIFYTLKYGLFYFLNEKLICADKNLVNPDYISCIYHKQKPYTVDFKTEAIKVINSNISKIQNQIAKDFYKLTA
ncbi:hypothetical protein CDG60_06400 [Acinetobacter chinensis]|uniref:Uncharacterized protein n=1 Tax=Acinetobacter chinensis TaxID=2004650 RepID=A0A3B7LV10_9GAMM|nr:hypothetical protein CDG60_06400 [Acinetobacter chinensis]